MQFSPGCMHSVTAPASKTPVHAQNGLPTVPRAELGSLSTLFSSAPPSSATRLGIRDFMNQADVLGLAKHLLLQLRWPCRQHGWAGLQTGQHQGTSLEGTDKAAPKRFHIQSVEDTCEAQQGQINCATCTSPVFDLSLMMVGWQQGQVSPNVVTSFIMLVAPHLSLIMDGCDTLRMGGTTASRFATSLGSRASSLDKDVT
eukprot:1157726-Pelagomonas_calceolata.AAC.9